MKILYLSILFKNSIFKYKISFLPIFKYSIHMKFKETLKDELQYQDITVKELAFKTGINKRTLDNYLRENVSQPTVENAVKIAQTLGVTVEYLVTGIDSSVNDRKQHVNGPLQLDISLCKRYYKLIQKLDSLQDTIKKPVCKMIEEIK